MYSVLKLNAICNFFESRNVIVICSHPVPTCNAALSVSDAYMWCPGYCSQMQPCGKEVIILIFHYCSTYSCPTAKLWQKINNTTTLRSAVEARFQVPPNHLLQGHFGQYCPHQWDALDITCSSPSFPLTGYFGLFSSRLFLKVSAKNVKEQLVL